MMLKNWLEHNEITVSDFAEMIGVKGARSVYRYINRERIPERDVMARIIEKTGGQVTADSFYN